MAQVDVCLRVVWIELDGPPKAGSAPVQVAEDLEDTTQVEVRPGIVGIEMKELAPDVRGLPVASERLIHRAKVLPEDFSPRPHAKGPANVLDGRLVLALLVQHQPQQVQGIGVQGVDPQEFLVRLFGLAQSPGLVLLQPLVQ